jgi:uncharacterized phage protein (TIGR02218 family)
MALRSALLARTPLFSADLYTLIPLDGSQFRWTTFDQDISVSAATEDGIETQTWSAVGPAIERSAWSAKNTTEVTQLDVRLHVNPSAGVNFKTLIHNGLLDGAFLQLDRAFMPAPGDVSLGLITLFGGRVGKIEIDSLGASITVQSSSVVLTQNLPRNTYQLGCIHTLYDAGCTLSRDDHTSEHTVTDADVNLLIYDDPPDDPSIYQLGVATITSGAGAGQSRTIDLSQGAIEDVQDPFVRLAYPLYIVPAPGDTFTLTEGCNKTLARCAQFANSANFRGFPAIPAAELGL